MNSLIYTLIQLAATLAMLAENSTLPVAVREQTVRTVYQAIQTALLAPRDMPVDVDANIDKLYRATYLTEGGARVSLGTPVPGTGAVMSLVDEYTSFGDLDSDTMHDAMPLLKTTYPDGTVKYHLAALRNFGGVFVNTVNQPFAFDAIYEHRIQDKGLYLEYAPPGKERTTTHFILHANYTAPQPAFVLVRNPAFDGRMTANTQGARVASFLLIVSPDAPVEFEGLVLDKDFNADVKLANLRLVTSGGTVVSEHPTILDGESNLVFLLNKTIPAGTVEVLDFYADVRDAKPGVHRSMFDVRTGSMKGQPWPVPLPGQDIVVH